MKVKTVVLSRSSQPKIKREKKGGSASARRRSGGCRIKGERRKIEEIGGTKWQNSERSTSIFSRASGDNLRMGVSRRHTRNGKTNRNRQFTGPNKL